MRNVNTVYEYIPRRIDFWTFLSRAVARNRLLQDRPRPVPHMTLFISTLMSEFPRPDPVSGGALPAAAGPLGPLGQSTGSFPLGRIWLVLRRYPGYIFNTSCHKLPVSDTRSLEICRSLRAVTRLGCADAVDVKRKGPLKRDTRPIFRGEWPFGGPHLKRRVPIKRRSCSANGDPV